MNKRYSLRGAGCGILAALAASAAAAAEDGQTPIDRADPATVEEEAENVERTPHRPQPPLLVAPEGGAVGLDGEGFVVGAIRVDGATVLTQERFSSAIEPYLGRPLSRDDLRGLSRDVAAAARAAGYGLAVAWVPRQSIERGLLRVRLEEGRIDAVQVEGPAREAVARRLDHLAGDAPLRTAELERRLLLAGDLPGVRVREARIVRRDGRNVLIVSTSAQRIEGRATLDRSGSRELGPLRARLTVDVNGVLGADDRVTVGGVITPLQPREAQYAHASYSAPLGGNGTEVSLRGAIGHTRPGGALRDRNLEGLSTEAEATVSHPFLRGRNASLWGRASIGVRDSELERAGAPVRDDRIVTATAGLFANGRLLGGRLRTRISFVQGLNALGATRRGDPLASRDDAGGAFFKLELWSRFTRPLGGGFGLELSGEAQLASRPLLSSEEMGLGGRQFLRAFAYREMAGDQGAAGAIEIRYDLESGLPRPLRRVQFYLFGDAGRVTNLRGGFGGGSLASAGGGARFWLRGGVEAGAELAAALTDGLFEEDPDPRFSFSLSTRF